MVRVRGHRGNHGPPAAWSWAVGAAVALTVTMTVLPREALSQPVPVPVPVPVSVPVPDATPEARARAAEAFEAGLAAFRREDYAGAARSFEASYAAVPHPFTLYNMGRAYVLAGRIRPAIERFERYRRTYPEAPDLADVVLRLNDLRGRAVQVFVTSTPAGASIRVDGAVAAGTTPATLQLASGVHALELDLPDHRPGFTAVTVLPADPGEPQPPVQLTLEAMAPPETMYDRILARRPRSVNFRLAALGGVAWPRDQYVPAIGFEATVFWRHSLAAQVHFLQIETDGTPMVITGELGWVFVVEDLDLGIFAHAGAVTNCEYACRDSSPSGGNTQFLGGVTLRADVVLLPRVGIGLYGRFSWRHLDITDSASLLSSLGLSISFLL